MVLIDNSAHAYGFQIENGVPIIPYYEGETDNEMKDLEKYLFGLLEVKDVRVCNRR